MSFVLIVLHLIGAGVSLLAHLTGRRGDVTKPGDGYPLAEPLHGRPEESAWANALVGRVSVVAGLLFLAGAAGAAWWGAQRGPHVPTWVLLLAAGWTVLCVSVLALPFELIRRKAAALTSP